MNINELHISSDLKHRFGRFYFCKYLKNPEVKNTKTFIRNLLKDAKPILSTSCPADMLDKICFLETEIAIFVVDISENKIMEILNRKAFDEKEVIIALTKDIKPKKKKEPPLDMSRVVFSNHALWRFSNRFRNKDIKNSDLLPMAKQLLSESTEYGAISKVGYVKRIIDNNFVGVRYFSAGKNREYRFVVKECDDKFVVLTFEAKM